MKITVLAIIYNFTPKTIQKRNEKLFIIFGFWSTFVCSFIPSFDPSFAPFLSFPSSIRSFIHSFIRSSLRFTLSVRLLSSRFDWKASHSNKSYLSDNANTYEWVVCVSDVTHLGLNVRLCTYFLSSSTRWQLRYQLMPLILMGAANNKPLAQKHPNEK